MTSPAEHAATVREALETLPLDDPTGYAEKAFAALDALEAQAEAAQREADIQMGAKLAAQMTLKAVCDVLNLPMVSLGNGWTEATPKILARIETIVDEADRGFRERDAAELRAVDMEKALRELVDAVRVLDVMLREPAAEGLMSAEDYRSYLSGAWLGVDEKTAAARAALSAREEAQ